MNINEAFPSKYLKAADIKGKPPVRVVIESIKLEQMEENKPDSIKPVIHFEGKKLGFACNKTNAAMITHSYGPETDNWIGKAIELRCEPVAFQGKIVDSIRVAVAQVSQAEVHHQEQAADNATMDQTPPDYPDSDFDEDIPF